MSMTLDDLILATSRGDPETAYAYLDRPDDKDRAYVFRLWYWAGIAGVDAVIAYVWFLVETADATSIRWNRDRNPGGVGIPSDSTVQPFAIPDGDAAARIHVQCLYSLVTGELHSDIPLWPEGLDWMRRVWLTRMNDPNFPTVRTLTDLDVRYTATDGEPHATWAWGYELGQPAQSAIAKAALVFPQLPNQQEEPMADLQFGNVDHPPFTDRLITGKPEGVGWSSLGQRSIKGVVWHRIVGYLWGTDTYFRRNDVSALTDYGVGVAAADGTDDDGLILRWNDPRGWRSGWASGPYNAGDAYGDGKAFVDEFGVSAVNRDQVSIEIAGFVDTPLSERARDAIAGLTAYYADQMGVPWDQFPIWPEHGYSVIRWHNEFTGLNYKTCPGTVVMSETDALIERTRAVMKRHQVITVDPKPEPLPDPEPEDKHTLPEGMSSELAARLYGRYAAPWDGTMYTFDLGRAAPQVWLARGKRSTPDGKPWSYGAWPALREVIRRGDGGVVYRWEDGSTYEREAA